MLNKILNAGLLQSKQNSLSLYKDWETINSVTNIIKQIVVADLKLSQALAPQNAPGLIQTVCAHQHNQQVLEPILNALHALGKTVCLDDGTDAVIEDFLDTVNADDVYMLIQQMYY